jgi:hypothetical protein
MNLSTTNAKGAAARRKLKLLGEHQLYQVTGRPNLPPKEKSSREEDKLAKHIFAHRSTD